jgi:hypothetical protein
MRLALLILKWALWSELLGFLIAVLVWMPLIYIVDPRSGSLSVIQIAVIATGFAGWGVMMIFLRLPALLLSAGLLAGLAWLKPSLEASFFMSTSILVVVGLLAAEIGFQFVSGGSSIGGSPRFAFQVWILSYLLGARLIVPSLRAGSFLRAMDRWRVVSRVQPGG